jgi:hypothetical protein
VNPAGELLLQEETTIPVPLGVTRGMSASSTLSGIITSARRAKEPGKRPPGKTADLVGLLLYRTSNHALHTFITWASAWRSNGRVGYLDRTIELSVLALRRTAVACWLQQMGFGHPARRQG